MTTVNGCLWILQSQSLQELRNEATFKKLIFQGTFEEDPLVLALCYNFLVNGEKINV